MYPKENNRFEELKERAGLGRVPNGALAAVLALVVVLLGYALWSWWTPSSGGITEELYGQGSAEETATEDTVSPRDPATATSPQEAGSLTVHVVGAVMEPGVYELESGSRIGDAIAAAGGVNSEAEIRAVNFAEVLTDGTQVVVPTVEEAKSGSVTSAGGAPASGAGGSSSAGVAANGVVNINAADAATLETLPGIGPTTAGKIITDREKNGPFKSASDLQRVSGIGPKKYEALTGLISVQ